jgi:hypothetical protein
MECVGDVAYHLHLPAKTRIHDVFHVVFLKKHVGAPPDDTVPLPPIVHGRAVLNKARVVRAHLNRSAWELSMQ